MIQLDLLDTGKNNPTLPTNLFTHPEGYNGLPAMVGSPGYTVVETPAVAKIRAMCVNRGIFYVMVGTGLYSYVPGRLPATVATLNLTWSLSATSEADMEVGNDYVCAVENGGANVRTYKISTGVSGSAAIAGVSALGGLTYQDGYYITWNEAADAFYVSALNDPTTWSALDFEDAEYKWDYVRKCISFRRLLFVFGDLSLEIYENTGNTDFPFERMGGGVFDVGIAAKYSLRQCGETLYWLAHDKTVMRLNGITPERISSIPLEKAIGALTTISDAVSWTFIVDGMEFYVLVFPTGNTSFAFNTKTGEWFKFCEGAVTGGTDSTTRHQGHCSVWFQNKTYIGDCADGTISILSLSTYTNATISIYRERQIPVIHANRERMFFGSFELWARKYVGGATTVNQPTVSVQWSDDNGITWSTARTLYLGLSTNTGAQLQTHRLGSSFNRIFKISVRTFYNIVFYGAFVE